MAISNGYATLQQIKDYLTVTSSDATKDGLLERAVEAASRAMDRYCGRFFYDAGAQPTAKKFRADDPYEISVPDFHTVTGLVVKTDTTGDGTFDTTWDSSGSPADYQVEPLDPAAGWPWTSVVAIDDKTFPVYTRKPSVEVTARWGWAAVPKDVENACLLLAAKLYKRKDAVEGELGLTEFGAARILQNDPHLAFLLDHLRRVDVRAV